MSSELFKKFSEELKATRESKDISLQQISNKTRINLKFLEAIEEGNFGVIDEVYVRAFLREYAQMIELDSAEVMEKYDRCKAGIPEELETPKVDETEQLVEEEAEVIEKKEKPESDRPEVVADVKPEDKTKEEPEKIVEKEKTPPQPAPVKTFEKPQPPKPAPVKDDVGNADRGNEKLFDFNNAINSLKGNKVLISAVSISILIIFIIIYFAFIKESKPQLINERPYEEIVEEKSQKYEEVTPIEEPVTQAVVDSLTLMFSASDTSWIQVVMDDSRVEEFILLPSVNKSLRAESDFNVLIGNSGGIELFLNNNSLNFIGRRGGVRNIIVDKNGYRPAGTREPAQNE